MITSFRIQGFKCFRDLELSKLSRVTILGGRNNVGKSTVLEALFLFLDRLNPQMITRQYAARGVREVPLVADAVFAPIFQDYNLDVAITLSASIDRKRETMRISYNPSYAASRVPVQQRAAGGRAPEVIQTDATPVPTDALDITYGRNGADQGSHLVLLSDAIGLEIEQVQTPATAAIIGPSGTFDQRELATRFGQLDVRGRQGEIVRFLQIIEPNLKSLSSITVGPLSLIHGDIGLARKIPVAYVGDGMSRLLGLIVYMATTERGLVMIDEVENGIHHSVMPRVWKAVAEAARQFDCQVVATTHSYECLRAAHEGLAGDLAEDLSYIRLDRVDGRIVAKHYDHAVLGTALEADMEVR